MPENRTPGSVPGALGNRRSYGDGDSVREAYVLRKIRELIRKLRAAGFREISGPGKGAHREFGHAKYPGAVALSGKESDDAKHYRAKQVDQAIESGKKMKEADQYHKWIEWSDEDQVYIGKCPDLITGIHGDDPVVLYGELCDVVSDVVAHFRAEGRPLPPPRVRPMQRVA